MESSATVSELARSLNVDPKHVRAWMRRQGWRHAAEAGSPWMLTSEQVQELTARFQPVVGESAGVTGNEKTDGMSSRTVSELLGTYSDVLAELRLRGLIRTNNAPIGDLAEYCAAVVYEGLLAPNSEKSYDLIAADGRRVQVKVRVLRSGLSPSAVFSSVRSFEFDTCIFILISDVEGKVATAREWTVAEVRSYGKHRDHTNGTVVRVRQLQTAHDVGNDMTTEFDTAWRDLLAKRR